MYYLIDCDNLVSENRDYSLEWTTSIFIITISCFPNGITTIIGQALQSFQCRVYLTIDGYYPNIHKG